MHSTPLELLARIELPPVTQVDLKKRGKKYLLIVHREELVTIQELGTNLKEALGIWNKTAEKEETAWKKTQ